MTTIAYDGKTLATDSLMTSNSLKVGSVPKIFTLLNGDIVAGAGSYDRMPLVVDWLNGVSEPPAYDSENTMYGIVIPADGSPPFEFSVHYIKFKACIPWAGGSGETIALTAMKCGKTAVEAVEIACELDIYSDFPVQEHTFAAIVAR